MITIICKISLDSELLGPGYGRINFVFKKIPIILPFDDLNYVAMDELKKIRVLGDLGQPVCTLNDLTHYFSTSGQHFPQTADSNGRLNDDVVRQAFADLPKSNNVYSHMHLQYDEKDEQVFKKIITERGTFDYSVEFDEFDEIVRKHVHSHNKIKIGGRSRVRRRNRQKSKKTKNVRRRGLFTKKC